MLLYIYFFNFLHILICIKFKLIGRVKIYFKIKFYNLGRRGLLLPTRLPEVVPIVLKALDFDEKRANLPVGAVIRDSACYVSWSFARAFDKDVLQPYINSIASALVVVTVFDREVGFTFFLW